MFNVPLLLLHSLPGRSLDQLVDPVQDGMTVVCDQLSALGFTWERSLAFVITERFRDEASPSPVHVAARVAQLWSVWDDAG
jgi:hypothetical protein